MAAKATRSGRRALGRGLTNLIPQDSDEMGSGNEVAQVDVSSIQPNPFQPRKEFSEEEIASLADSIAAQGLLQPVLLRKHANGYQIISGERRFRALRKLGRKAIPALVRANISDREMLEMALVENVQRADLNEIDKAQAYERLLLECKLKHEELSKRVGVSRSAITNALRLLRLDASIQDMVKKGAISAGHARALAGLSDPGRQKDLAAKIVTQHLSVRELERLSQHGKSARPKKKPPVKVEGQAITDPDMLKLIEKIRYRLGTRVDIVRDSRGGGSVKLAFFSDEDLQRVLELLMT